jgi:hypothetical protein
VSPKINHDGAVLDLVNARLAGQNPAVPKVGRPSRDQLVVESFRQQLAARNLNRWGLPAADPAAAVALDAEAPTPAEQAEPIESTPQELAAWAQLDEETRDLAIAGDAGALAEWLELVAVEEAAG